MYVDIGKYTSGPYKLCWVDFDLVKILRSFPSNSCRRLGVCTLGVCTVCAQLFARLSVCDGRCRCTLCRTRRDRVGFVIVCEAVKVESGWLVSLPNLIMILNKIIKNALNIAFQYGSHSVTHVYT